MLPQTNGQTIMLDKRYIRQMPRLCISDGRALVVSKRNYKIPVRLVISCHQLYHATGYIHRMRTLLTLTR